MNLTEALEKAKENDLVIGDRPRRYLGDYYRFAVINSIGTFSYIQNVQEFLEYKEKKDSLHDELFKWFKDNKLPTSLRVTFDLDSYLSAGAIPKKDMQKGYYLGKCRNATIAYWDDKSKMFKHTRSSFNLTYIENIPHLEETDYSYDLFIPIRKLDDNEVDENSKIDKWKDGIHIDQKEYVDSYLDKINEK